MAKPETCEWCPFVIANLMKSFDDLMSGTVILFGSFLMKFFLNSNTKSASLEVSADENSSISSAILC